MDFYLISYDVPAHGRRTKIASLLEDYGQRVQLSVFEVWLDKRALAELLGRLDALLQPEEDSVRVYRLCSACQAAVIVRGLGSAPRPPGALIV